MAEVHRQHQSRDERGSNVAARQPDRKPAAPLHHNPGEFAQGLLDSWAGQSSVTSLPRQVQRALSVQRDHRVLRLMAALLQVDDEDAMPLTAEELRRALARGKATAPGDDAVTYSALRLLQQVPGNPLF